MQRIIAGVLLAILLLGIVNAFASKASPPRETADTPSAGHVLAAHCAQHQEEWSQTLLCRIRAADAAIALCFALVALAAIGLFSIRRARAAALSRAGGASNRSGSPGGREWESNPPRID